MKNLIFELKKKFQEFNIDGYIIPKNDEFFSEYAKVDRLKIITDFSGSAGYAVILKNKNYLFVDGRYTIQAKIESGKNFKIVSYNKIFNCRLFKNLKIGIDPRLFTKKQIKNFLSNNNTIIIDKNLVDLVKKKKKKENKPFYSLSKDVTGESHQKKINTIVKFLKKNKIDYIFITAPENVAWMLNIRGYDNPTSPIPNCNLIINKFGKKFIISEKHKVKKLILEKKINKNEFIDWSNFKNFIDNVKSGKISIDDKTCSIFYENILKKNL